MAMARDRFAAAVFVARGEMSTPQRCRWGVWGFRREERRRGMQPVPVQRSRIRRGGREREARRREARWVVRISVSGLGIRTPLLHDISSAPNGCDPRMYCNGFPLARSRHI